MSKKDNDKPDKPDNDAKKKGASTPPPITPPKTPPASTPNPATQRSVRSQIKPTGSSSHHIDSHTAALAARVAATDPNNPAINTGRWAQAFEAAANASSTASAEEIEELLRENADEIAEAHDQAIRDQTAAYLRESNDAEEAPAASPAPAESLSEDEIARRQAAIDSNETLKQFLSAPAPSLERDDGSTRTAEDFIRANKTGEEYFADEQNIDGALQQLRWDNDMDGMLFSQFVYWFYPKPGEPLRRQGVPSDTTVYYIKDKNLFLTPVAFQKAVIDQQTAQAAEEAQKIYDDDLIPPPQEHSAVKSDDVIDLVAKIKSGEADLNNIENAVVYQGEKQLARRNHDIGVIAAYKGGKSTLMDHMVMCMLTGHQFFCEIDITDIPAYIDPQDPAQVEHPGKVLIVDPERGEDMHIEIPRAFMPYADEPDIIRTAVDKLVVYDALAHPLDITNRADQQTLIEFIKEHHVTRVVLDSCMYLAGTTDNISDIEVDSLFRAWSRIRRETGVHETWWVVHTSHGDRTRAYGSQRWMARLQSMWLLERDDTGDNFHFTVLNGRAGTRYPRRPWALHGDTRVPYFTNSIEEADREETERVEAERKKMDRANAKKRKSVGNGDNGDTSPEITDSDFDLVNEIKDGKLTAMGRYMEEARCGMIMMMLEEEHPMPDGEIRYGGMTRKDAEREVGPQQNAFKRSDKRANVARGSFADMVEFKPSSAVLTKVRGKVFDPAPVDPNDHSNMKRMFDTIDGKMYLSHHAEAYLANRTK